MSDGQSVEQARIESARDMIVEVLSWGEDIDSGRWGYERAADLLDTYVEKVVACLATELDAVFEHYDKSPALYPTAGPEHPAHLTSAGALRASEILRQRVAEVVNRPGQSGGDQ